MYLFELYLNEEPATTAEGLRNFHMADLRTENLFIFPGA